MQSAKLDGKVLVTGGGGYIGAVTVGKLLENGYQVRVLDVFLWGKKSLDYLGGKIEIVEQDIRQAKGEVLEGISAVIHLAAISTDKMAEANPAAAKEVNTDATERLAEMAKKKGIKRFIYSSSASIYQQRLLKKELGEGKNQTPPLCTEVDDGLPSAIYSVTKYQAEKKLLKLADRNFYPVIFRQGTVYGVSPRMRYDLVVNSMVKSALLTDTIQVYAGGRQWRPLVYVGDVADAYLRALEVPVDKIGGQIFNLVYKNYQIGKLAEVVREAFGKTVGVSPKISIDKDQETDRTYRISGQKIKEVFNWVPETSVEEAVAEIIGKIKEKR